MVTRIPQCDSRQLELALIDRLSASQSEMLSRHLSACPHCRVELEALAGEKMWWYVDDPEQVNPCSCSI